MSEIQFSAITPRPSVNVTARVEQVQVAEVPGHPGTRAIRFSDDFYMLATAEQWRDEVNAKVEAGFAALDVCGGARMTHVDDAIKAAFPHAEIVPEELGDADLDYVADLGYLRTLRNHMLAGAPGFNPTFPNGPTVEQRLLDSMSATAKAAISDEGWTFEEMWANA